MDLASCLSRRTPQKDVVFTRMQVEGMIADGRTVTIIDGKVLKVDAWLRYHPGGEKAIMHMVGRDATDEVNAYASPTLIGYKTSLIEPLTDYTPLRPASTC